VSTTRSTVTVRAALSLLAALALVLLALQPGGSVQRALGASPLSITNVDTPDPVVSGQQILYTITMVNTGGAKVTNAILNDQFNGVVGFGNPPLLDATSSRGGCTQNNTQVTCNGGTIEGGGTWTVTIRGKVTAATGATINNIATVTGNKSAQTFTNSASATTQVTGTAPGGNSPDLTIGKNGPLSAAAGGDITYTLTVNNVGDAPATGIKVTDTVPLDTGEPITATGTSLFSCSVVVALVTCSGGQVNAGANGTITIKGKAPATGPLVNTSVVDPEDTIDEGVLGSTTDAAELNNTSNTITTAVQPGPTPTPTPVPVRIDKTGPAQATPGELIDYTIVVTNGPIGRADYVTMTDGSQGLQAASLQVLSAVSSGGTTPACTVSAPTVTCTMTRLPAGGTMTVKIRGMVIASAGSTIINNASVNANIKNTGYSANDSVQTVIKPGVDLTITKVDSPDPVCASSWPGGVTLCAGGLTYTYTVSNSGINQATNVVVRDAIPAGLTYDDAASSAFCNETSTDVITCVVPLVDSVDNAPANHVTFSIKTLAPSTTGSITNTVTVDPFNAVFESDETNNVATATTQVVTGIDLTVDKFDEPPQSPAGFDPIATSGTETYVIEVDNLGPQDATGIRLRDALPSGSRFISATATNGFTCTHDGAATGGVVECIGGSIRGTASEVYLGGGADLAKITIKAFARPTVGTMVNEVRVDPLNEIAEIDETNNITVESTTVINGGGGQGAFNELAIDKTGPATVATSGVTTYSIAVSNDGSDPAVNVTVRDTLPAGFTYIDAFDTVLGPNAFLCTPGGGNTIDCTGATIAPAGSRTITLRAFASSTPGLYTNQAIVDPGNLIPEGNETNNADNAQTTVQVGPPTQFIDLTVSKTDTPDPVTPGATITYVVTVNNGGTNPAFNVLVRDLLPPGTAMISARDITDGLPPAPVGPGGFSCTQLAGVVDCTGGTLDGSLDLVPGVGASRQIQIKVQAPLAVTDLTNNVTVDPLNAIPEGNETNNQGSADTAVRSKIDLTIEKSGPTSASQNTTDTYELTVKNTGEAPAFGVVVEDRLPVGLIPLLAFTADPSSTDFTCQILENPINVVRCQGTLDGTLDSLTTFTNEVKIKIKVFITAQSGTLDNEACVDPDNTIVEIEDNLNNCSTASTQVGVPDVSINKAADTATATPGENVVYTLTVSNVGDGPTSSEVTITDPLDPALTLVSATATNGFSCGTTVPVTCSNGAGSDVHAAGLITTITVTATVGTAGGAITNTASVTQDALEPLAKDGNNHASVTLSVTGSGVDLVAVTYTDQPDPVPQGDSVTYTAIVTNAGAATANAVKIQDVFSSLTGMTLVSATASQGFSCALASLTVECNGNLGAGQSTTVTIVFQTDSTAPASVSSTVTVDPGPPLGGTIPETNEANNSKSQVTTISNAICSSCIDLVMGDVIETPDPVKVGNNLVYTITVGNVGDQSTDTTANDDLLIFFDLVGDFTFVSRTASNGITCATDGSTTPGVDLLSNCTGELAPHQGTIITITVTPNSDPGPVSATAFADPSGAYFGPGNIAEFNESNNGPATETTTVVP
jgi:uncharacterized repeat protein (TIGR01451 family)